MAGCAGTCDACLDFEELEGFHLHVSEGYHANSGLHLSIEVRVRVCGLDAEDLGKFLGNPSSAGPGDFSAFGVLYASGAQRFGAAFCGFGDLRAERTSQRTKEGSWTDISPSSIMAAAPRANRRVPRVFVGEVELFAKLGGSPHFKPVSCWGVPIETNATVRLGLGDIGRAQKEADCRPLDHVLVP